MCCISWYFLECLREPDNCAKKMVKVVQCLPSQCFSMIPKIIPTGANDHKVTLKCSWNDSQRCPISSTISPPIFYTLFRKIPPVQVRHIPSRLHFDLRTPFYGWNKAIIKCYFPHFWSILFFIHNWNVLEFLAKDKNLFVGHVSAMPVHFWPYYY